MVTRKTLGSMQWIQHAAFRRSIGATAGHASSHDESNALTIVANKEICWLVAVPCMSSLMSMELLQNMLDLAQSKTEFWPMNVREAQVVALTNSKSSDLNWGKTSFFDGASKNLISSQLPVYHELSAPSLRPSPVMFMTGSETLHLLSICACMGSCDCMQAASSLSPHHEPPGVSGEFVNASSMMSHPHPPPPPPGGDGGSRLHSGSMALHTTYKVLLVGHEQHLAS